jgi:hypothetical protein
VAGSSVLLPNLSVRRAPGDVSAGRYEYGGPPNAVSVSNASQSLVTSTQLPMCCEGFVPDAVYSHRRFRKGAILGTLLLRIAAGTNLATRADQASPATLDTRTTPAAI